MNKTTGFVPHIAGLRGLAVILVFAQHYGVPGFDAGFIGVDVFFVISGFLITGILVDEYARSRDPETRIGTISLKAFYLRRARRILPAALVVSLAILIFSWFINNSARFGVVASDAIWSTLFSANLNFAIKSTDYFQIGAAPSPFQHFWSLSVEEQFYFIWPALILAALSLRALRFRGSLVSWQSRLCTLFIFTSLASLVFMVVSFYLEPSLSYFLTSSRAWELSLGAFGAILIRSEKGLLFLQNAKWLGYLPIPLLILSLLLIRSNNFGYTMPLVVIATLILVSKPADSKDLDSRLFSGRVPKFLGNISYSLYLWHWPVLTFGTELGFADDWQGKFSLALISLVLATLSYFFVELKFQRISIPKFYPENSVPLSKATWIGASSLLLVGVIALPSVAVQPESQTFLTAFLKSDVSEVTPAPIPTSTPIQNADDSAWYELRQSEIRASNLAIFQKGRLTETQISEINRVSSGDTYARKTDFTCSWGNCTLGNPSAKIKILLLGDSHALMYHSTFSAMRQLGHDLYVNSMIQGLCANFSGTRSLPESQTISTNAQCEVQHQKVLDYVAPLGEIYDYVILSDSETFNPKYYVLDAATYAKKVKKVAKKTVILGQAPISKDLSICLNKDYSNYSECSGSKPTSMHDFKAAQAAEVSYGDLGSMFCVENYCPLIIGNSPVSARGHLTDAASSQIAQHFLDFLKDAKVPSK